MRTRISISERRLSRRPRSAACGGSMSVHVFRLVRVFVNFCVGKTREWVDLQIYIAGWDGVSE